MARNRAAAQAPTIIVVGIEEQRARDALAFDPLPPSKWVRIDPVDGIIIAVRYSEPLSRLLRGLPGATWNAERRWWRLPYASADALRTQLDEINRLAAAAQQSADAETEARNRRAAADRERRDRERTEASRRRALARPRPLRREFLLAADGPKVPLVLEAIGDDIARAMRAAGQRWPSRAWVAQLFGTDGRGGWVRAFLSGARDYTRSNAVGSRGITINYLLEQGPLYEVSAPASWRSTDRYFARIEGGTLRRMTAEEALECLEK